MSEELVVSVAQAEFPVGEVDENLRTIDRLAGEAARAGADLAVFPERATTGYTSDLGSRRRAEPLDGPVVARLGDMALAHAITLVTSVLEQDGELVFNSAVVIGPDGRLAARHRKTHLFGPEKQIFEPGDDPVTITRVGPFAVAVLVCYEAEFPEMVRAAALAGADLVAIPTATSTYGPGSTFARQLMGSRATENNLFVAYANHCGPAVDGDYMGGSLIAGPRTAIASEAGTGSEILSATLSRQDRLDGSDVVPYLADRRPDLYGA